VGSLDDSLVWASYRLYGYLHQSSKGIILKEVKGKMDKIFLGVSWKGNPAFGLTVKWDDKKHLEVRIILFGLDLFGLQITRSKE
jgi:hypothetical protein